MFCYYASDGVKWIISRIVPKFCHFEKKWKWAYDSLLWIQRFPAWRLLLSVLTKNVASSYSKFNWFEKVLQATIAALKQNVQMQVCRSIAIGMIETEKENGRLSSLFFNSLHYILLCAERTRSIKKKMNKWNLRAVFWNKKSR